MWLLCTASYQWMHSKFHSYIATFNLQPFYKCCPVEFQMLYHVLGPSYTVDSACSSSLYALEHAYKSIRDGHCQAAIVGGCNLCLHPYVSLQFSRLGVLSPQGMCKSFDRDGRYNSSNYNLLVAVILCYSLDIVH